jgi:hypothetical protein
LARNLLDFTDSRFLNAEFWLALSNLFKRFLRYYLDTGARTAWLAERALAYQQNRKVDIIGMNYFPIASQGIGGADRLLYDLSNLEAARLDGERDTLPIKHTFSLIRDFPLQYASLRSTGRCSIFTSELPLQKAFPGSWGFRIIALEGKITRSGTNGAPLRGLIVQSGGSQISNSNGELLPVIRPAGALPISEFSISDQTSTTVYGFPGSTLMPFEGSGVEAVWEIVLPQDGNPTGLAELADLQISFHIKAFFSPALYISRPPTLPGNRALAFSAANLKLSGLETLR